MNNTELLQKIVDNTSPKESFTIQLNSKETKFITIFSPVIQLDNNKKYEMALVSLETYFSFPNIDEKIITLDIHQIMVQHGLILSFQRGVMK